ncbi:MAG: GspH/FimT family pseudopilin [Pseudomonadota bacterium]
MNLPHTLPPRRPRVLRRPRHLARGLTLVELMVTLTVMAVLLGVAVPSFQDAIESSRLSTRANDLLRGLQTARSEAIRRNGAVRFCSSSAGWNVYPGTDNTKAALRSGTAGSSADFCADFRANGLPYACTCATAGSTGTNPMTDGTLSVTVGSKSKTIHVKTGSIYVQ